MCDAYEGLGATSARVLQGSVDSKSELLLLLPLSCRKARAITMHLWLLLSAALAFVPQRSVPAIRGLQAVVEDIDALSFRELQAACKERGLPARGATDVLRERLREHLADAPSDAGTDDDAIDLDAALAADEAAFAEEELIAPDADPADDDDAAFDEEELIPPDAEADDDDAFAAQLDAFFAEEDEDADDAAESARRALKAARAPGPAAAAWADRLQGGTVVVDDDVFFFDFASPPAP